MHHWQSTMVREINDAWGSGAAALRGSDRGRTLKCGQGPRRKGLQELNSLRFGQLTAKGSPQQRSTADSSTTTLFQHAGAHPDNR